MGNPEVVSTLEENGKVLDGAVQSGMPPPPYTNPGNIHPNIAAGVLPGDVITTIVLGPDPVQTRCPNCAQFIVTEIDFEMGNHAYTWAAIFCILGGLLCVWIPACATSMQDVLHYCPACRSLLGRFNR